MEPNGHEQITALTAAQPLDIFRWPARIDTLQAAEVGIQIVESYGVVAYLELHPDLAAQMPTKKDGETTWSYAHRVAERLLEITPQKDRRAVAAAVLDLGLARADLHRELLSTAQWLLGWRVYIGGDEAGLWLDSPGAPESFDEWLSAVRHHFSKGTVSKMSTSYKALAWVLYNDNGQEWRRYLPQNVEEVFLPGNRFKWVNALAGIKRTVDLMESDAARNGIVPECKDRITNLLEKAADPETTVAEMGEEVKQRNLQMPKIPIVQDKHQPDEPVIGFHGNASRAQWAALRRNRMFDVQLEGQEYGLESHSLVEYRRLATTFCTKCATLFPAGTEECPVCGTTLSVRYNWSFRQWQKDRWTVWEDSDEPRKDAYFDSRLDDPELGVTYYRYWVNEQAH